MATGSYAKLNQETLPTGLDQPDSETEAVAAESGAEKDDSRAQKSGRHIESIGPGKNVLMPDIYGEEYSITVPELQILGQPDASLDESGGFNPYDTAVFVKK